MYNLSNLGLIVIVSAWIIQFFFSHRKKHDLNPLFVIFSALGFGILAMSSYSNGMILESFLYLASFIVPVAVLLKISK